MCIHMQLAILSKIPHTFLGSQQHRPSDVMPLRYHMACAAVDKNWPGDKERTTYIDALCIADIPWQSSCLC